MFEFLIPAILIPIGFFCFLSGARILYLDKHTYELVRRWKQSDYVMQQYGRYLMCRISRSQFQQDMSQFHNNRTSQFQGFTFADDDLDDFLEEKSREGRARIARENNHLEDDLFEI